MKKDDTQSGVYSEDAPGRGAMLIRDMASDQRPREKALNTGIKSLSDAELMAIIFSTGIRGKSVIQLCQEILADNDNHLSQVARLSVADFKARYKGIGTAKAISLLAALELGERSAADALSVSTPTIASPADAVAYMRPCMSRLNHEEFWVLLLSQSGKVRRRVNVSRGGLASTIVDVKIIIKHALDNYAASMILFHNHPSGNLSPSPQDDALTRRIVEAARLMDIRVNDHIIVTDGGFYSYRDHDKL